MAVATEINFTLLESADTPNTGFFADADTGGVVPFVAFSAFAAIFILFLILTVYLGRKTRNKSVKMLTIISVLVSSSILALGSSGLVAKAAFAPGLDMESKGSISFESEPGFAYACDDVVTKSPTSNGYVLKAYVDSLDVFKNSDSSTSLKMTEGKGALGMNTWGYFVGNDSPSVDSEWNPMPLVEDEDHGVGIVTIPTDGDSSVKVCYGVNTDETQSLGSYKMTITYESEERQLYMQDVSDEFVEKMELGVSVNATDLRDMRSYTIAKLDDGNVWMTQNLDLDLVPDVPLTNDDTDLNSKDSWTPNVATQITEGIDWMQDINGNSCDDNAMSTDEYAACLTSATRSHDSGSVVDGNYYSWYTATAGSGEYFGDANSTAPDSICPKGWHLPSSNTFSTLISMYLTDHVGTGDSRFYKLIDTPFEPVFSGFYDGSAGYSNYRVVTDEITNWGYRYGEYQTSTHNPAVGSYNYAWIDDDEDYTDDSTSSSGLDEGHTIRCVRNLPSDFVGTLKYDANAGDDSSVKNIPTGISTAPQVDHEFAFEIDPDMLPERDNYAFMGWSVTPAEPAYYYYYQGDTYKTSSPETVMYAMWEQLEYDITYVVVESGVILTYDDTKSGGEPYIILDLNMNKEGYNFDGWRDSDTDVVYQPGDEYDGNHSLYLYPMWSCNSSEVGGVCLVYMQDMTPTVCAALTSESQFQLKDKRDGKLYWISKLNDGNCWMTQNLDYDIQDYWNDVSYTNGTRYGYMPVSWDAGDNNATLSHILTDSDDENSYDQGDYYMPGGTGTKTASVSLSSSDAKGDVNLHYHLGNLYQWGAATAGSGKNTAVGIEASMSICPEGWRLPTMNSYTTDGSYGKLTDVYGATINGSSSSDSNMVIVPLFFVRSGWAMNGMMYGGVSGEGDQGMLWTSGLRLQNSGLNIADVLSFDNTFVTALTNYPSDVFAAVRCVANKNLIWGQ